MIRPQDKDGTNGYKIENMKKCDWKHHRSNMGQTGIRLKTWKRIIDKSTGHGWNTLVDIRLKMWKNIIDKTVSQVWDKRV